jgi:hypothetical protein
MRMLDSKYQEGSHLAQIGNHAPCFFVKLCYNWHIGCTDCVRGGFLCLNFQEFCQISIDESQMNDM